MKGDGEDVDLMHLAHPDRIDPLLANVRRKLETLRKILWSMTNTDFSYYEALQHWKQIQAHHRDLSDRLDRTPDLSITIIDYFTHVHKIMKAPMPIDQAVLRNLYGCANKDFLTGAYNRHFFFESLNKEIARSSRSKSPLSLLLLDINDFERLADSGSPQNGDPVLLYVATTVKETLRTHDLLCRYEGNQFTCLLPDTNYFFALVTAERLRRRVAESAPDLFLEQNLSLSYGVANYPLDNYQPEELLKICATRLYESKAAYRDWRKGSVVERREHPRMKTPGACGVLFKSQSEKWDVTVLDIGLSGVAFQSPQGMESVGACQMHLFLRPPFSTAWVNVEPRHVQQMTDGEYRIGCRVTGINFV